LATTDKSARGTGGMQTKLDAARTATAVGINVILASGRNPSVLQQVLAAEPVGTLFAARGTTIPAWKRWIGYSTKPKGRYVLDAGARHAVEKQGRSLLAAGIQAVQGEFFKGEVVSLIEANGTEFARGLTNYNSADARRIAGQRTDRIRDLLGSLPYAEVIHRDNLVVIA
jgi:glutamate 5-kinase